MQRALSIASVLDGPIYRGTISDMITTLSNVPRDFMTMEEYWKLKENPREYAETQSAKQKVVVVGMFDAWITKAANDTKFLVAFYKDDKYTSAVKDVIAYVRRTSPVVMHNVKSLIAKNLEYFADTPILTPWRGEGAANAGEVAKASTGGVAEDSAGGEAGGERDILYTWK